ncbi:phosphatidylinositol-specific phospholipase C domain-containing protein [Pseudomonas sp. CAU 1711]|uniref:phosphatidylinositol-specific phospholipase C domain-containing protein n=1 Tax=Pseudomonas sp. CAU 1711 TaxID=3140356 RepID=UPI0032602533
MKPNTLAVLLGISLSASLTLSNLASADTIDNFNNSWSGKALDLQRALDNAAPMSDNNILGTHNTYNSEAYTSCNFSVGCRYLDPQQKYSIKDQLRMGARFIELDVHWTAKMESLFSYPKRLLLCHGVCSLNDKYATEGFSEVASWLNDSRNADEVIILYIEDHSSGRHSDLASQLNKYFGAKIYASNGCKAIPTTLTKAQVLAAGKQVVLWKDGGCSSTASMANMAFTGLGEIGRIWEDSTTLGSIAEFFDGGIKSLSASDVRNAFLTGANIVNLDDMVTSDGRISAAIWSWDNNEPNNANNEDCAVQKANGRWNDASCSTLLPFACRDDGGNWQVPDNRTGQWSDGQAMCATLGGSFSFAAPTNSQANQALRAAKEAVGYSQVWLNYDDIASEGQWQVNRH